MSLRNMLILEENFKRHLEAFASELFILSAEVLLWRAKKKKKLFSCDLSLTDVLFIYLFEINIA